MMSSESRIAAVVTLLSRVARDHAGRAAPRLPRDSLWRALHLGCDRCDAADPRSHAARGVASLAILDDPGFAPMSRCAVSLGMAVVVRREGAKLARFWLVGTLDLGQAGLSKDGNKYKVISDTIR